MQVISINNKLHPIPIHITRSNFQLFSPKAMSRVIKGKLPEESCFTNCANVTFIKCFTHK